MQDTIIVGNGSIGGKATGFFKAKQHFLRSEVVSSSPSLAAKLRFPVTACIATDVFDSFVEKNQLWPLIHEHKWKEETAFEILKGHFLFGKFSDDVLDSFREILKKMTFPLAVRSSSMLEDRQGTSFAGKYDTIFISNHGSEEERLSQLCHAVKEVYASTYNPSALIYRKKHRFLKETEHMAILLQEAIGREYKGYFLPLMAGVGFSRNGFCWNDEIKKEDGIIRLVFGLGTRAVGRGYARIISPGKPSARPEGTNVASIAKFSQGLVDVLDLKENCIKHIKFREIVADGFDCYPRAERIFSLKDEGHLYVPPTNLWNKEHEPIITFDGIIATPWLGLDLPQTAKWVFKELETAFECPVDLEFAVRVDDDADEAHFYLVQARPLSQREELVPKPLPRVPDENKIFAVSKGVPTAWLEDIEYIVYVDPIVYKNWPLAEKHAVARVVGKLNEFLEGKVFILMGPGRWGSGNPDLGIPVKYAEISNAKMLVEVSIKDADYLPEVSYGTHFFQDLIEDKIIYIPLFPDEDGSFLNKEFFEKGDDFGEVLLDDYYSKFGGLVRVINVPKATGGARAHASFNGKLDKGLVFVK